MVSLAIRTHIPVSEWVREGDRAIWTALQLLRDEEPDDPDDGPRMSG